MKKVIDDRKQASQCRSVIEVLQKILPAVLEEKRPADRVLADIIRKAKGKWGSRDRRLISESVFAVFRWYGVIKEPVPESWEEFLCRAWILEKHFGSTPYIPEAIQALKKRINFSFVCPESLQEIAGKCIPDWVVDKLPENMDIAEYVTILQRRPPVWMRAKENNSNALIRALAAEGVEAVAGSLPGAVYARPSGVNLYTVNAFRNGLFEIQDLASQAIGAAAAPVPGERWWDACAGAGGKTLLLAEAMKRRGTVVASDIRAWKLEDLRKRARRGGFPNIETREFEPALDRARRRGGFDGVLIDAPCSCSGVWRRNPDGKWSLTPEEVHELAGIQADLLQKTAQAVKKGGVLVYATCSIFPEENENTVNNFLAGNNEFELAAFPNPLTGEMTSGMMRFEASAGDCDWMFACRMRRKK